MWDVWQTICSKGGFENRMKRLVFQTVSGWHHGRGSKYSRKGNFEMALKHYRSALEYASRSDNEGSIVVEMECIARTLVRLGDYEQAESYATKSLTLYKTLESAGAIFTAGANRVTELIKVIQNRGSL
jgi:tetratricopeptide (TPR) repeat protein